MHTRLAAAQRLTITAIVLLCSSVGFSQAPAPAQGKPTVTSAPFGKTPAGADVALFTLTNSNGLRAKVMEYGGIVVSLEVPDREGKLISVVQGSDNLASYTRRPAWTGAIVGRFANRISNAKFTLDGTEYRLTANTPPHQLHGGREKAFNNVVWKGEPFTNADEAGLKLTHRSLDGEEGYPGNLDVTVTYALTNKNELRIQYLATTDKPTVINMTNHSYFNLAGSGSVLEHEVMIDANSYTVNGQGGIPTGEIRTVEGTPLDFRTQRTVGSKMDDMKQFGGGDDHNYVLSHKPGAIALASRAYDPKSGRVMECYTDQPGLQFYTGDRTAYCFETQHFPDSPNKPNFPSTELRPGGKFESTTVYKFSTK
jgi:aldose 1-epimerase